MSNVTNPRIALTNVSFQTAQYKEHLERVLEQLWVRSGGGVSNVGTLSDDLTELTQLVASMQLQIDSVANDLDTSELAITQLQADLLAANNAISNAQNSISNIQITNAQQSLDIADLQSRVTALETP